MADSGRGRGLPDNFLIRGPAPEARVTTLERVDFDRRLWEVERKEGLLLTVKL